MDYPILCIGFRSKKNVISLYCTLYRSLSFSLLVLQFFRQKTRAKK